MFKVLTALILLSVGCSSTDASQNMLLSSDRYYMRDLVVKVNGKVFEGVGVLPNDDILDIEVESRGNITLFTMSTCEGILPKDSTWNITTIVPTFWGWGERKVVNPRKVGFKYRRTQIAKEVGYCPMILESLDSKQGQHAWGFFDFNDLKSSTQMYVECNFKILDPSSVQVCQSKKQSAVTARFKNKNRIFFPEKQRARCMKPVCDGINISTGCVCNETKTSCYADNTRFAWLMAPQECEYRFVDSVTKEESRLTTIGGDAYIVWE